MGDYLTKENLSKQVGYTSAMQLAAPNDLVAPIASDFRETVKASPGALTGTSEQQQAATEAATRIDTAIDQAESIINDALAGAGYSTPADSSLDMLAWATRALAISSLYAAAAADTPEAVKLEKQSAMNRIRDIRDGRAILDGATRQHDTVPKVRARDQVFDSDLLDTYPGS